jgi:hypothetical protein
VKWVLAELVRLGSQLTIQETQQLVDKIVERQYTLVWKSDGIIRILDTKLVAREKVLVLLYDDSPRSDESLRSIIEYRNGTGFRAILRDLHRKRLIEYKDDQNCVISPAGLLEAEAIIRRSHHKIK